MAAPANWSRYLAGSPQDFNINDPAAQASLQWVQQFDPSARYQMSAPGSGEGANLAQLIYDNSKLPQNVTGGRGIEGIARLPGSGERMVNPNATFNDPNFGQVTFPQNLQEKGPSLVDIIGPIIVGLATAGGGLAGLAPGMAAAGFDTAGSGAFAAGGGLGAGAGGYTGGLSSMLQRIITNAPRALNGFTGGGQSQPTFSPGQLMLLRLFAARQQGGGG